MRFPFSSRRVASADLSEAQASILHTRFRHQRRRLRLIAVFAGIVLLACVLPFSQVRHQGYGGGAAAIVPTCGTQLNDIVAQLLKTHPDPFKATITYATPSKEVLMHFPTPQHTTITASGEITYDPKTGQICVGGWDALNLFPPQTLGQSSTTSLAQDVGSLLSSFWKWAGDSFKSILDGIQSFTFMLSTPKALTYDHDVVKKMEAWMVTVVDSLLALVLVVGGYGVLFGTFQSFREFLPRLVTVAIAAHFCLPLLAQFIEASNELCLGVLGILASAGIGNLTPPLGIQEILNWATAPEYLILVYLIELLFAILLSLQMLLRIALLDLLLVTAPLGLLCFALPQTRAWGTLWAQAFVATLIAQFLQLLCLGIGAAMAASFGHGSLTPVSILVGIAALFLAGKVPDMLLSNVMRARVLSSGTASDFGQQVKDVAGASAEWIALALA